MGCWKGHPRGLRHWLSYTRRCLDVKHTRVDVGLNSSVVEQTQYAEVQVPGFKSECCADEKACGGEEYFA